MATGSLALCGAESALWLWPERSGTVTRIYTRDQTYEYSGITTIGDRGQFLQGLRDRDRGLAVANAFGVSKFGSKLEELLFAAPSPPALLLVDDCARNWPLAEFPIEWLFLGDKRVGECTVVVRSADPSKFFRDTPLVRSVFIADLWDYSSSPLVGLTESLHEGAEFDWLRGSAQTMSSLSGTDLRQKGCLILFAHGTESEVLDAEPLQDESGNPWTLPVTCGVPPLVILLACGTDTGNLAEYGRQLLGRGATTVIAPYGKLDASHARQLLDVLLPRWLDGEPIGTALLAAKQADSEGLAARRMVLLGSPYLNTGGGQELFEQTEFKLAERFVAQEPPQHDIAASLADRLTLLAAFASRNKQGFDWLDAASRTLHDLVKEQCENLEMGRKVVFKGYDGISSLRLGTLTRIWLLPVLAKHADQFGHDRIEHYIEQKQKWLGDLEGVEEAGWLHHCWHRLFYRKGNYATSLYHVVRYCKFLDSELPSPAWVQVSRDVANILIDMLLPQASWSLAEAAKNFIIDRCEPAQVDIPDPHIVLSLMDEQFKLNDTLARAGLRSGNERSADLVFNLLEQKRLRVANNLLREYPQIEASNLRNATIRELAWQLYSDAWQTPGSTRCQNLVEQALEVLDFPTGVTQGFEAEKNNDLEYLLRALAVFAWRTSDERVFNFLADQLKAWSAGIATNPVRAFVCVYLNLHSMAPSRRRELPVRQLEGWGYSLEILDWKGYHAESATFAAMLGDRKSASEALARFHQSRTNVAKPFPTLIHFLRAAGVLQKDIEDGAWSAEVRQRENIERLVLLGDAAPSAEMLLSTGLLPL